jgi:hypothetical protein
MRRIDLPVIDYAAGDEKDRSTYNRLSLLEMRRTDLPATDLAT